MESFRCLRGAGNTQPFDVSFARGKTQKTSRNSRPNATTATMIVLRQVGPVHYCAFNSLDVRVDVAVDC